MSRVLHVCSSMDPATGGPPAALMRIAAAQAAMGIEVHTLAYGLRDARERLDADLARVPNIGRVIQHYLPDLTRPERIVPLHAIRTCRKLCTKVDFVHVHGVWDQLIRVACSSARRAGIPYAVTPHCMLNTWSLQRKSLKKQVAWKLAYRRMLDNAAFIHALTDDEKSMIESLKLRPPIVVAPNGIFFEEIEPLPPAGTFRAAHPQLGNDPYVLFLGRLHFQKGVDVLADSFALLLKEVPNVRLVVAGPDYGARDALIKQIASLGIASRVHLVGPIFGQAKYAAYVDAACFCLPSRQEGFSVAVLEALACGTPVVISEACHFPQVESAGAGEVVASLDVAGSNAASQFAGALAKHCERKTNHCRHWGGGTALVRESYAWSIVANTLAKGYLHNCSARVKPVPSDENRQER